MAVDRIVKEEALYLDRNLLHVKKQNVRRVALLSLRRLPGSILTHFFYLCNLHLIAPGMKQLGEHAVRSAFVDLAQATKLCQLVISHAHVHFIRLHISFSDRLQFRCRCGIQEAVGTMVLRRRQKGLLSVICHQVNISMRIEVSPLIHTSLEPAC